MEKEKKLEKIHKKIRRCNQCPLWETRKNAVPGEGSPFSEIMIVGQAPGANENETGRPFIGRAGALLSRLLESVDIERESVFITSALKCFPPKNRKPEKKEIIACLPYLKEQIEIINPKTVVLLGQVALSIFFPERKLNDVRGKWIDDKKKWGARSFFVVYHPAAGIRFVKMRKILERDFKKIKQRI